jgi:cytochrome c553
MNQNNLTIDPAKRSLYERELESCMQKYKDKKSELQWADNDFEESLIEDEMEKYAIRIRSLKQALGKLKQRASQTA